MSFIWHSASEIHSVIATIHDLFYFLIFLGNKVSLCSLGWPQIQTQDPSCLSLSSA
jgi:hypothetical protein